MSNQLIPNVSLQVTSFCNHIPVKIISRPFFCINLKTSKLCTTVLPCSCLLHSDGQWWRVRAGFGEKHGWTGNRVSKVSILRPCTVNSGHLYYISIDSSMSYNCEPTVVTKTKHCSRSDVVELINETEESVTSFGSPTSSLTAALVISCCHHSILISQESLVLMERKTSAP